MRPQKYDWDILLLNEIYLDYYIIYILELVSIEFHLKVHVYNVYAIEDHLGSLYV